MNNPTVTELMKDDEHDVKLFTFQDNKTITCYGSIYICGNPGRLELYHSPFGKELMDRYIDNHPMYCYLRKRLDTVEAEPYSKHEKRFPRYISCVPKEIPNDELYLVKITGLDNFGKRSEFIDLMLDYQYSFFIRRYDGWVQYREKIFELFLAAERFRKKQPAIFDKNVLGIVQNFLYKVPKIPKPRTPGSKLKKKNRK